MIPRPVLALAAALLLATPCVGAADTATRTMPGVADPYQTEVFAAAPMPAIDAALAAAARSGKHVLLVMGTNGCHDSAWFANLVATDRFAPVRDRYEIVFADIGMPHIHGLGRNPDVAKRFGFKIRGTPTIAILDARGHVLNRKAAPKWSNAASRADDDIYDELMR